MAKVSKVGNSLVVYLPKEAAEAVGLVAGDEVDVRPRGGLLELVPIEKVPRLRPKLAEAYAETKEQFGPAFKRLAE